ncbi:MAG: HAMP domain-containing histidine kinase [Anaerolineae bacterium]|nr:HAMP domain-containing histidine kinase [Anaerolineae bacterium]
MERFRDLSPVQRYGLISFATVLLLGATLGWIVSYLIRTEVVRSTAAATGTTVRGIIRNVLTPEDYRSPMTGPRYEEFNDFLRHNVLSDDIARVKVWSPDRVVVYSDITEIIGQQFLDDDELEEAIRNRVVVWDLAVPARTESVTEHTLGRLMAIYAPVIGPDGTLLGVYEVYLRWAPLEARIWRLRLIVWTVVLVMLGGLYLALWGTFRSASRTIVRQKEEAEALTVQLQEALRAKDVMVQNVSHELRTPLTHIIGYVDVLLQGVFGKMTSRQEQSLEIVKRKADQLSHIVNDLLLLQDINREPLQLTWVHLEEIATTTMAGYEARAAVSGIHLITDFEHGLPLVTGDAQRIQQVFTNLIDNAIKFSPDGGDVIISVRYESGALVATVTDHGIGIATEELDKIWLRFYQVEDSSTRHFGGLGLGLAICKHIIEGHNGRIWAESEGVGKGSRFAFSLPTASPTLRMLAIPPGNPAVASAA